MAEDVKRDELLAELEDDADAFFGGGKWNNIFDLICTFSAVIASLAATGLAAAGAKPQWIVAVVAGVPAAATSLQKIIRIRERSNWYFRYSARIEALETELRYVSEPNVEQYAYRRGKLGEEMESEWSEMGLSGETRQRRAANSKRQRIARRQ